MRTRTAIVLLAAPVGAVACFDAPAQYSVPERTPPIIDVATVLPSTLHVDPIGADAQSVLFDLPSFTADHSEQLSARFYQNLYPSEADPNCRHLIGSPILEQQASSFSWQWIWQNSRPVGCNTVTLILTYASNLRDDPDSGTKTCVALSSEDVAQVTWFLDFEDSSSVPGDVTACPPPLTSPTSP